MGTTYSFITLVTATSLSQSNPEGGAPSHSRVIQIVKFWPDEYGRQKLVEKRDGDGRHLEASRRLFVMHAYTMQDDRANDRLMPFLHRPFRNRKKHLKYGEPTPCGGSRPSDSFLLRYGWLDHAMGASTPYLPLAYFNQIVEHIS